MPKIEQDGKEGAKRQEEQGAKSLAKRAREVEEKWRTKRGLSKGLHCTGNAMARERRRRAECPAEPKAAVRFRRYLKKQLGKLGAASTVRYIDPAAPFGSQK